MSRFFEPIACLAFVCAFGCAMGPEVPAPLNIPEVEFDALHRGGTVLTGDRVLPRESENLDPAKAHPISLTVHYLRAVPTEGLVPLGQKTRLVVAAQGSEPLAPVTDVASAALVGLDADAAALAQSWVHTEHDAAELTRLRGIVHPGVTVVFQGRGAAPTLDPRAKHVAVLVSRSDATDEIAVALQIDDVDTSGDTPRLDRRQIVVLSEGPRAGGVPLVLVFPSPFGDRGAFLAELTIRSGSPDEAELAAVQQDLARAVSAARDRARALDRRQSASHALVTSLDALKSVERRRQALVHLAVSTGAELAGEVALCASEETLDVIATRITAAESGREGGIETIAGLGWRIERACWSLLAERLDQDEISPEMRAVLVRRGGEAGRFPGMLPPLLQRAKSLEDLEQRLIRENEAFLMDMSPAARVRSCDWLRSKGIEIPDYDPLGDRRSRFAAMLAETGRRQAEAAKTASRPTKEAKEELP